MTVFLSSSFYTAKLPLLAACMSSDQCATYGAVCLLRKGSRLCLCPKGSDSRQDKGGACCKYTVQAKSIDSFGIKIHNKKHSENADTSTSVTFDLELWPWPYIKVKKAYVIRLLYCTLVPGIMSVSVIVCEIWLLVHFMWPLTFACNLHLRQDHFHFYHKVDVMLLCIGSKYKVSRFNRIWDMDNCLEKT